MDFIAVSSRTIALHRVFSFLWEDAKALDILAVAENEDLKEKLNELNHEVFEVLCGALPDQSKERMQKLFKGFW